MTNCPVHEVRAVADFWWASALAEPLDMIMAVVRLQKSAKRCGMSDRGELTHALSGWMDTGEEHALL
jgi:hypothetical protein